MSPASAILTLILGLKQTVQNHSPTLHKVTNPSEEAKGFEGHLNVLMKLYRLCQVGISFWTTESDLEDTLEPCLISVCYYVS